MMAKFSLWAAQCTPMADGVIFLSCATTPFLHLSQLMHHQFQFPKFYSCQVWHDPLNSYRYELKLHLHLNWQLSVCQFLILMVPRQQLPSEIVTAVHQYLLHCTDNEWPVVQYLYNLKHDCYVIRFFQNFIFNYFWEKRYHFLNKFTTGICCIFGHSDFTLHMKTKEFQKI